MPYNQTKPNQTMLTVSLIDGSRDEWEEITPY